MTQDLPANPNHDSVRVVLELALHDEERLANRANWLDTKTGAVLGFVIVSVAELLGFLLLASREKSPFSTSHPCLLAAIFVLGLIALIVAMFLGLSELAPMGFQYGAPTEFFALQIDREVREIQIQCVDSLRKASIVNRDIVRKKARLTKATVLAVGVALCFYAAAVAMLFFSLL